MIPTTKPSRNPSTVHGVYSRGSLIPGRGRHVVDSTDWMVFGGRGRRLPNPVRGQPA